MKTFRKFFKFINDTRIFINWRYSFKNIDNHKAKFFIKTLGLLLFSLQFTGLLGGAISSHERAALIALYNSTKGDNWKTNTGWKDNNPEPDGFSKIGTEGTWFGISVTNDHVTSIIINNNLMTGLLPSELEILTQLQTLDLSWNRLSGTIPAQVGKLISLKRLALGNNELTGSIPGEIGQLSLLEELNLKNNKFNGAIPVEMGNLSRLRSLYLDWNELSGGIPPVLGNLAGLMNLDVSYNQLSGSIPQDLGNLENLQTLRLNANRFSGNIPPQIGNLSKLTELRLQINNFSGSIPSTLGNLTKLGILDFQQNNLSGTIPAELGQLTGLVELRLNNNSLEGPIPSEFGNLTNLFYLDLFRNNLSGSIPVGLSKLKELRTLRLNDNSFSESIPKELGNLTKLGVLDLSGNDLTGSIPSTFGNFSSLSIFDLSDNNLTGTIPSELETISSGIYLDRFDLSNNDLTGTIPQSLLNIKAADFSLANNQLSGILPELLGSMKVSKSMDLSDNDLSGEIPSGLGSTTAAVVKLSRNRLTGNIPATLFNAKNSSFYLDSNSLSGEIPSNVVQLPMCSLSYNALYSSDSTVKTYLDKKNPGWDTTQTVAPTGLFTIISSSTSIRVNWIPISFKSETGGYEIYYRANESENWLKSGSTTSKNISFFDIKNLEYGKTYYFKVKTWTDAHPANKGTVYSEYSESIFTILNLLPRLTVDPTKFEFEVLYGSKSQVSGNFNVSNSGGGIIEWNAVSNSTWCKLSPTSGTGDSQVKITVDSSKLLPGVYNGLVTVSSTNASNSPQAITVQMVVKSDGKLPSIYINRTNLYFGAQVGKVIPGEQTLIITNNGEGILKWTASSNAAWLQVSPNLGSGGALLHISVNPEGLAIGEYEGIISISSTYADNSPQFLTVQLKVKDAKDDLPTLGAFDSPKEGASVYGNIAITGWAIDDTGVDSVKIYRDPVDDESEGLKYVGDAVLVEGARPDIELLYPDYPMNYKAGWGYMLLSYFLPNMGNGTYRFYAYANDSYGNETLLGSKTIVCDNTHSTNPFGAIDTPIQGGLASGTSYVNYGWVLAPQPNMIPYNGSTINVWVDGKYLGHPIYNQYREDIAGLFPGLNNSNGAAGYFYIDTTGYLDGIHTIAWVVKDNAGNEEGIGSRYFSIINSYRSSQEMNSSYMSGYQSVYNTNSVITVNSSPISILKGFKLDGKKSTIYPDHENVFHVTLSPLDRVEIHIGKVSNGTMSGYMNIGERCSPLPVGSSLDISNGIFYWQPGPGFSGEYSLEFITKENNEDTTRISIRKINITISR